MKKQIFIILILSISTIIGIGSSSILNDKKIITCEHYDIKRCRIDKSECEITIKECTLENSEKSSSSSTPSCYVVWLMDNGQPNITLKGCFTDNKECNQTECISRSEPKNGIYFCCCKGSMCNLNHDHIPTTTEATTQVPKEPTLENNMFYIIVAIVILTIMIISFAIGLIIYKKTKPGMFNEIPTIEPEVTSSSPNLTLRPIELIEMKARGRFGAVWQGRLNLQEVAVKIFPMQEKESWLTEIDILKLPRMKHPNILEFIAAEKHLDKIPPEFWLVTAYHNYGSLCDYLKAHTITWLELCKIAESMSRGLMHLHEEISPSKIENLKPAIAHRDFKSKNVLLKNDLTACIADFGLAMIFQPGKPCGDTHGQVGTRRYMAPEVLEGAINFTRDAFLRIDVYACGLVLWEMVSRCDGHGGIVNEYTLPFETELGLHPSLDQMQENVVMKKLRPGIHDHWRTHPGLHAMCDTMEECWDHDAEARLSSSCVMERVSLYTRYTQAQLLIETNDNNIMYKDSTNIL